MFIFLEGLMFHVVCNPIAHIVRILSTSTALLLLSECTNIVPAKSIRDVSAVWPAVLSSLTRAVWPGAMVLSCGVCAAISRVEMGFGVCGSGGGSSRARYYLQARRAKRSSHRIISVIVRLSPTGTSESVYTPKCRVSALRQNSEVS